jgi:hypothetical protein
MRLAKLAMQDLHYLSREREVWLSFSRTYENKLYCYGLFTNYIALGWDKRATRLRQP